MKTYEAPALFAIEADVSEGVYAGSGSTGTDPGTDPEIPTVPVTPTGCWVNWQCTWTGHNNGGHSVCHVSASHSGDHTGNTLVMNFVTNFPISEVKNASGYTISNVGLYSFTITRNNFFNGSDNIGFNFEIVTTLVLKDAAGNDLHGAIGENNADAYYCKVASFTCS